MIPRTYDTQKIRYKKILYKKIPYREDTIKRRYDTNRDGTTKTESKRASANERDSHRDSRVNKERVGEGGENSSIFEKKNLLRREQKRNSRKFPHTGYC